MVGIHSFRASNMNYVVRTALQSSTKQDVRISIPPTMPFAFGCLKPSTSFQHPFRSERKAPTTQSTHPARKILNSPLSPTLIKAKKNKVGPTLQLSKKVNHQSPPRRGPIDANHPKAHAGHAASRQKQKQNVQTRLD